MLKITITETNRNEQAYDDIEHRAEAITLIGKAENILDNLIDLGIIENDLKIENRLAEVSRLLFTAHFMLADGLEFAELNS